MDIDLTDEEIIIYPTPQEIDDLLIGKQLYRGDVTGKENVQNMDICISPPVNENNDIEYYDDTLEALKKAYEITKRLENGVIPDKDEVEKIWNTYKYYNEQREKYK